MATDWNLLGGEPKAIYSSGLNIAVIGHTHRTTSLGNNPCLVMANDWMVRTHWSGRKRKTNLQNGSLHNIRSSGEVGNGSMSVCRKLAMPSHA